MLKAYHTPPPRPSGPPPSPGIRGRPPARAYAAFPGSPGGRTVGAAAAAVAYSVAVSLPPAAPTDAAAFPEAPLVTIWRHLQAALTTAERAEVLVPDPDRGAGAGVGARLRDVHGDFVHRPLRVWVDLAERLHCRLATPRPVAAGAVGAVGAGGGLVRLRFERLAPHRPPASRRARYAPGSAFARLDKLEDAASLTSLVEAYERVGVRPGARVLVLGVNRGDELAALELASGAPPLRRLELVGVDHSGAALAAARERFPGLPRDRLQLRELDVNLLAAPPDAPAAPPLGRFDLVVCVALLQSPGVDDRALLRALVQRHLAPSGALVLGLPNSRLADGDLLWGARTRNVGPVELGLLLKDAAFVKRYLQQHRFRVFVSGKYDLLITGVRDPGRGR